MKVRALILVLLFLLSTVAVASTAPAEEEETRTSGIIGVRMYLHLSPTESILSTEVGSPGLRPTTAMDFVSADLEDNLVVQTVDAGVGDNKGFEASFTIATVLQAASVTVAILDDDEVIAKRDQDLSSGGDAKTEWRIPLIDDADQYTFSRNNAITLRVTSDSNVYVTTDETSYLELFCQNHLSITTETRDSEDRRSSSFYPNDLAEFRHVLIEGDITNPFGASDVAGVNVSIRRPTGTYVIEDDPATVGADLNYSFDWDYETNLPAGSYTINVTGRDLQGNEFSTIGSFIMADYGVRIFAEGEDGGVVTDTTTPGTPAKYTLTILNIGGKRAEIVLVEGDAIPLWQTSFSRKTFSLDAGRDEDVTFDVKPSSTLGGGNESQYTVIVTVNNDPGIPKASDSLEVKTFVSNEVKLKVDPENPDPVTIAVDGTKDYTYTVRNLGEFSTNVDMTRTGVPTGWSAQFVGSRVTDNAIEDLRPMEIVDVILRVDAPTTSDVKKANIKVKVQSREYPDQAEERTFTFNLVIGLVLTSTSPTNSTEDPGDKVTFFFDARNNDPSDPHEGSMSVVQENSNWPSSSFRFTPSTLVNIQAGSTVNMGLEVDVPTSAEADVFRFTVKGIVDGNSDVYASFDFRITINLRRELTIELDPDASIIDIDTKEDSIVYLKLVNGGNQVEHANVTVVLDSGDVEVRMNDAITSSMLNVAIQPGATEQMKISFRAKDSASPNQVIRVTISTKTAADTTPTENEFDLKVNLSTSEMVLRFVQWGIVIIAMLIVMAVLLLWNPRKKRVVEVPSDTKEKDASHGAVVRH
jgi:uncharacterized membrane protein